MKHLKPIKLEAEIVNEAHYGDKQTDIDTIKTHLKTIHDNNFDVKFDVIGGELKLSFKGHNLLTSTNNNLGVSSMALYISGLASGILIGKEI